MAAPRTLAELKADPRVVEVWQEEDGGFVTEGYKLSYWARLADGFHWDDCSCLHEPTVARLIGALASVEAR